MKESIKLSDGTTLGPKDRILLVDTKDGWGIYQKHNGKEAVVEHIDDAGQIHCKTDDGFNVTVSEEYGDKFKKVGD